MKNILLITSLYPTEGLKIMNNTSVCHYFALEWKKMGYNVRVIFNYNTYPLFYYPILQVFRKRMANVFGISIQDSYIKKPLRYEKDGIIVDLLPIYKLKPGGRFSEIAISSQAKIIIELLDKEGFKPNLILGHFTHPNLELVVKLKEYYNALGTIALHGEEAHFSEEDAILFNKVDAIGYRSYPTKWSFEKMYGEKPYFMCPSGVPEKYITKPREFVNPVSNFIYVGTFMKRKYPSCLIPAISNTYCDEKFTITYIGDGDDKQQIVKKARQYNCLDRIIFTGRITREDIFQHLDRADVFIMVSKIETFGLVYLEAMARGCIVVASKNEGMDGIIEDGINGFLCEAGNEKELESIIKRIKRLSTEELGKLSQESINTAKKYTDYNVAKEYIKAIDK